MKKKHGIIIGIALLLGNIILFRQNVGINYSLYALSILAGLAFLNPTKWSIYAKVSALLTLITAISNVLWNTNMAINALFFSTFATIGFVKSNKLKSLWYNALATIESLFTLPSELSKNAELPKSSKINLNGLFNKFKLIIIPAIAFIIFYIIFKIANPNFKELALTIESFIGDGLELIFGNIGWKQIFFNIFLFIVLTWVFIGKVSTKIIEDDNKQALSIERKKSKKPYHFFKFNGLRRELKMANILIVSINALLIIVNLLDISTVWFTEVIVDAPTLSSQVHKGTYILIFSILLSIAIMMYYFRGNLNFLSKNQWVKNNASIWIFQNIILATTLAINNVSYISNFGMTYKRIGIILFLIMVVSGLVTLYFKINQRKSIYYIFLKNSYVLGVLFAAISCFNWDVAIANYNLNYCHNDHKDLKYLFKLSERTLPVLDQHRDKLHSYYNSRTQMTYLTKLDKRIYQYKKELADRTWQGWNLADQKAADYFQVPLNNTTNY